MAPTAPKAKRARLQQQPEADTTGPERERDEECLTQGNSGVSEQLLAATRALCADLSELSFSAPVSYVYNAYGYAWEPHERYVTKWGDDKKRVLFLGMNPGPFGMAQTGVPFGDVQCVRGWIGVEGRVDQPPRQHPKRQVVGYEVARREVSGQRFWGLMEEIFGAAPAGPSRFFDFAFVYNYCPLAFVSSTGSNITPDKLKPGEKTRLLAACDKALVAVVQALEPEYIIAVGKWAEARALSALETCLLTTKVVAIPHPSPANPRANKCWAADVRQALASSGEYLSAVFVAEAVSAVQLAASEQVSPREQGSSGRKRGRS